MGMFDTIVVEGLKLKAPKEVVSFLKENNTSIPNEYQSKDLDCVLNTYKINEKGDIYFQDRRPTGKKVPYKSFLSEWKDNRPLLERLYWKIKTKKYSLTTEEKLIPETKTVYVKSRLTNTFKMLSYDEIGGRYLTLDYEVKAIEGKVKSIKLLEWSIESIKESTARHKRDLEFKKNMDESFKKRKELQSQWFYPILREVYNPFIFFLKLSVQAVCNALIRWSYRWTGV